MSEVILRNLIDWPEFFWQLRWLKVGMVFSWLNLTPEQSFVLHLSIDPSVEVNFSPTVRLVIVYKIHKQLQFLLIQKETRFKYLLNVKNGLNRDQIESCSRYLHSLSLAATITMVGLPFSEDEISEYALTGSILLTLSTGLFLLGVYLLKGQKNG